MQHILHLIDTELQLFIVDWSTLFFLGINSNLNNSQYHTMRNVLYMAMTEFREVAMLPIYNIPIKFFKL